MKKLISITQKSFKNLLFIVFLCSSSIIWAQRVVKITGTANGTTSGVLGTTTGYVVNENLYLDSELGAGSHNSLLLSLIIKNNYGFPSSPLGNNIFTNVKISLKEVPSSVVSLAAATYSNAGYTIVYDGSITAPATNATELTIPLSTPFQRTAGMNLMVLIERLDGISHGSSNTLGNWVVVSGSINSTLLARHYNGNTAPVLGTTSLSTLSASRSIVGFTYSYNEPNVELNQIYTHGSLPILYASQIMEANVTNYSFTKVTNVKAYLQVSGANNFKDSIIIDSILPNSSKRIQFPNHSLSNFGISTITVSLAPVSPVFSTTPLLTMQQKAATTNTYGYGYGVNGSAPVANTGAGFNGITGDFAIKYHLDNLAKIKDIYIPIFSTSNGPQPFKVAIWSDSGNGTPGTLIWESVQLSSSAGALTLPITSGTTPIVLLNGDFFVGIRQLGTTNISAASQVESPLRPATFFYTSPTGNSAWTDLASVPNAALRLLMEITLIESWPSNDDCNNPTILNISPINCSSKVAGNTIGGTTSMPSCTGGPTNNDDVWFSFTASATEHTIALTDVLNANLNGTATDNDIAFQLFSGSCTTLNSIACVNNTNTNSESETFTNLIPGQEYFIRAYSHGGSYLYFNICVSSSVVGLGANQTVNCTQKTAKLQALGATSPYLWSTGETTDVIFVSPTVTTTYAVTATNGSSSQVTVIVDTTPPIANAGADVSVTCLSPSVTLTATGGASYSWSHGVNTASTTVSPINSTTYTVTVSGTNGCTATDDVVVVSSKIIVTANAGADVTMNCTVGNTTLTATGGTSYLWNNGETTASIIVSPIATKTYNVTVSNTAGCTASDNVVLSVLNELYFASPTILGNKFRVTLGLKSCATSYPIGSNNLRFNYPTSALSNPVIIAENFPSPYFGITTTTGSVPTSGILSINTSYSYGTDVVPIVASGTDLVVVEFDIVNPTQTANLSWRLTGAPPTLAIVSDNFTAISVAATSLSVPLKTVNAGPDVTVNCSNPNTILTATNGANYLWSTGETTASISVSPNSTTTYSVTSTNGSISFDQVVVTANKAIPLANAGADVSVTCANPSATLIASGGVSYLWSNGETNAMITVAPLISTNYIVTVTGFNGCMASDTVFVKNLCYPILKAKVLLNHVNPNNLLMDEYLSNLATFPLTDPYSNTAFNGNFIQVNNPQIATIQPAVLAITGNDAIVDWVFLELRQGTSGSTSVVYTKSALLQADGDIVAEDGISTVAFPNAPAGNYYIAVRHRNHLGFRTANTVVLSPTFTSLDFTSVATLYGSSPLTQIAPNVYAMNSGDANSDGSIDAFDTILWENQNGLFDEYTNNADYNLDGSVDAFDTILWELNNGKFQELD